MRSRKLVIQIPCYNEEASLPISLAELPRQVPGFDTVEWLVIDDGSTDGTVRAARELGVDHIVVLDTNRGLARAFMAGIDYALKAGADVIVNTDADNQYCAADIPALVAPIVAGRADLVVGARPIARIEHFSRPKKLLQKLGSAVVRVATGTPVEDAPSGFRAFSREAALRMMVLGRYTYTVETLFHAAAGNLKVACVPVRVNGDLRPSRLVRSIPSYCVRMGSTILRMWCAHHAEKALWAMAALSAAAAAIGFLTGHGNFGAGGLASAGAAAAAAILADRAAVNRQLLSDIRIELRRRNLTASEESGS